ncbi:MAG TPA: hypothetical protein ENJ06_03960 [Phycisphaeraceae bacterium]|nr:hypothetical protein [Phycisphaeraceae bacterium]
MTGKHVQPVTAGETQPRRTSLAIGLAVLAGFLCIAVLILSADRRKEQRIRQSIREQIKDVQDYRPLGEEIIIDSPVKLQDAVRHTAALNLRIPEGFWIREQSTPKVKGIEFAFIAITNGHINGEFWLPANGEWMPELNNMLHESGFNPPSARYDDMLGYLFSFNIDELDDLVARPRESMSKAREIWSGLWLRRKLLPTLYKPRPFRVGSVSGFVQLANDKKPSVYAVACVKGKVAAEVRVSAEKKGDKPEVPVEELNRIWSTLLAGLKEPLPADDLS